MGIQIIVAAVDDALEYPDNLIRDPIQPDLLPKCILAGKQFLFHIRAN